MSEGQGCVGVGDHVYTPTKERRDCLSLKVVPNMQQKQMGGNGSIEEVAFKFPTTQQQRKLEY